MQFMKMAMFAALGLTGMATAGIASADSGPAPTVVEMFTSKYCPNCPMAESKLEGVAAEDPNMLVIFEHVDYWDRKTRVDPFGLADVTQRQYDISGAMGKRQGEVFTPMPIIDGQIMVSPPLMFTWGGAMDKAHKIAAKPRLNAVVDKDGSLEVTIPPALYAANREVWVLGVEPVEDSKVWRVRGLAQGEIVNGKMRMPTASQPNGKAMVVLLQEVGPGAVVAMGSVGVTK